MVCVMIGAMEFRVRPGTVDDWSAYRALRLRMLSDAPSAYAARYADEARLPEERWQERAVNPMLFLAYAPDGRLVGTAAGLRRSDAEVVVVAMYVEPAHRGQGCAGRLLEAIAAAARQYDAERLLLHITTGNRSADRSYTRYGFTRTGRSWPLERDPELTEIEMVLDLTPDGAG